MVKTVSCSLCVMVVSWVSGGKGASVMVAISVTVRVATAVSVILRVTKDVTVVSSVTSKVDVSGSTVTTVCRTVDGGRGGCVNRTVSVTVTGVTVTVTTSDVTVVSTTGGRSVVAVVKSQVTMVDCKVSVMTAGGSGAIVTNSVRVTGGN